MLYILMDFLYRKSRELDANIRNWMQNQELCLYLFLIWSWADRDQRFNLARPHWAHGGQSEQKTLATDPIETAGGFTGQTFNILCPQNQINILVYGSVCFHSSISSEMIQRFELQQKHCFAITLGSQYGNYKNATSKLNLSRLDILRSQACLT